MGDGISTDFANTGFNALSNSTDVTNVQSGFGTVTQEGSKATAVILNTPAGLITMNGAVLTGGADAAFTLTNSYISANDILVLTHTAVGAIGAYTLNSVCAAGSAVISVRNTTGVDLGQAIVIQFAVIHCNV
jgi:hypothetical protein